LVSHQTIGSKACYKSAAGVLESLDFTANQY